MEGTNIKKMKIPPQVTTFFESYKSAFEKLDEDVIAGLFVYPLHITGDDEQITPENIGSKEVWIQQLRQLLRGYRAIGFSSANLEDLAVLSLSPRLFQATVHWDLRDRAEAPLYDFTAAYTLIEKGRGLRITAITHNELPRFRAHINRNATGI